MTLEDKLKQKEKARKTRNQKRLHKENEKLRTRNYQQKIDSFKKNWKKKGVGRAVKVKGETMPTSFCCNTRCGKGWSHFGGSPLKEESMKVGIIFYLT